MTKEIIILILFLTILFLTYKINKKKAKILIIGLGYVGYPLLSLIKSKIKSLKLKDLENKSLLLDEVGAEASIISKVKAIRKIVHSFQLNFAYNPPKKYQPIPARATPAGPKRETVVFLELAL